MAYRSEHILLALSKLRPELQNGEDFELADLGDGNGPVISLWRRTEIAKPTREELENVDTESLAKEQAIFLARDLLAQLTVADYSSIAAMTVVSPAFGLLWSSLLAQGEAPISVTSDRFRQGWNGLKQVLGAERSAAIAAAIGIPG